MDTETVSTIISTNRLYNKDYEKNCGLQTDAPLKRAIMPNGIRMVKQACEAYGASSPNVEQIYTMYRKATIRVYLTHMLLISGGRRQHYGARRIW